MNNIPKSELLRMHERIIRLEFYASTCYPAEIYELQELIEEICEDFKDVISQGLIDGE